MACKSCSTQKRIKWLLENSNGISIKQKSGESFMTVECAGYIVSDFNFDSCLKILKEKINAKYK